MRDNTWIVLVLLWSCTSIASESSVQEKLVGVWGNSEDNGRTFWGYDQFNSDGTTLAWGVLPDTDISIDIEGNFAIIGNDTVCFEVARTNQPNLLQVGEIWCDTIIKITDTEFHFRTSSGSIEVIYKINQ